ncbi:hypothetical protein [Helicobacter mustelae]|uniref:hypothetical protein n=2 Tax=Helicobacter mustelae TaxID=217 RepID=UPI0011C040E2|nr:hypothetical protein [Helicobacter mustelae]
MSEKNKLRLTTQFSYINIKNKNTEAGTIAYQLSDNSFIPIPILNMQDLNQDYLNANFSIRYGITDRIEIFSSVNGYYQHTKISNMNKTFSSINSGNFGNWNLGVVFQIKKEDRFPSLFAGFTTDIMKTSTFKNKSKLDSFSAYNVFLSSFYTVDPIVFFVQASLFFNLDNKFQNSTFVYGKIFTLNPMIYFAINPSISLNVGVKYYYKTADKINHKVIATEGSSIGYNFGLSYEATQKLFVFFNVENLNTSSYINNNLNLSFLYKF